MNAPESTCCVPAPPGRLRSPRKTPQDPPHLAHKRRRRKRRRAAVDYVHWRTLCPECGGKARVYHTAGRTRYLKCVHEHTFKAVL